MRARAGAGAMARVRAKVSLTVITPNDGRILLTLNLNYPKSQLSLAMVATLPVSVIMGLR